MSEIEGQQLDRPPRPPVRRFFLVRHGETQDSSFFPDHSGHGDPGLSALGRRQAEAIARELAATPGPPILAVYSSPLAAAATTAGVLSELLELPPPAISGALATIAPEVLPEGDDGLRVFAMLGDRIWSAVEGWRDELAPDSSLILVSHDLPIRALICRALGIGLGDAGRLQLEEASLSSIEFRGARTLLSRFNDLCHQENATP